MNWDRIIYTIFILIAAQTGLWMIRRAINTILIRLPSNRAKTVGSVLKNFSRLTIWVVAITTILPRWGVNITPFLTGAGVVGVAVAFGSQTLVRDIVTGLFSIAENYIGVGDDVEIAGKKGKVVSVKLRTIIIRNEEDNQTHIIPHSAIGVITKFGKRK